MTPSSRAYRNVLAGSGRHWLADIARGIEKEGLRVNPDSGMLAQTPHPRGLGSALTHPAITTDYSESLLEFITGVSTRVEDSLAELGRVQRFTATQLDNEIVWGASMPCIVSGERGIPIAHYGSSHVGTMKRVYRNGLGVRYGRMMQAIAGIHYNFSLPEGFWLDSWQSVGSPGTLQDFKTEGYLGLIRNFFSRVWLLVYLLGASPAVCASFLAGNKNHQLIPVDPGGNSLHLPFATSLRMGDLGYNSDAQKGLDVCYNSLDNYVHALHNAIVTPHPGYQDFTLTDEGEQAQLNTSLLQIENEFYSPIRPKRVTASGEAPLLALQRAGIEYIEVRCVDINPYLPLGIDAETVRLIDLFLVSCLLADSPMCDESIRARDKENLRRVVNTGRDPQLYLIGDGGEIPFATIAGSLLDQMAEAAAYMDEVHGGGDYAAAMAVARERVEDPNQTPSGRLLNEMREKRAPFWQLALGYSRQWHRDFLDQPLSEEENAEMLQAGEQSLAAQARLETELEGTFEDYLADFYRQYQQVKTK